MFERAFRYIGRGKPTLPKIRGIYFKAFFKILHCGEFSLSLHTALTQHLKHFLDIIFILKFPHFINLVNELNGVLKIGSSVNRWKTTFQGTEKSF